MLRRRRRLMLSAGAIALSLTVALSAAAQDVENADLLFDCDTLDAVTVSGGADWPDTVLELSADEQFVSQGEASIHLSGVSPEDAAGNSYLSIDIDLGGVDMTRKAILFDVWTGRPENTQALYVRAYNAQDECVLSFLNWSGPMGAERTTITLVRGFGNILAWEPKMVESDDLSSVQRLRFYIGTHGKGVPFDFYLDNILIADSEIRSFMDIEEPKELFPQTPIVVGGEPQAQIIAPADGDWAEVARELQAMVRELTGAELPIVPAGEVEEEAMRQQTAIVVGNVVVNREMLYLYSHGYIFPDDYYPGDGGYEVRTVHDPWATGHNVLSIGASDPEGARAGLAALRETLQAGEELVLEPTLLVELSADARQRWGRDFDIDPDEEWLQSLQESAERALDTGQHGGLFSNASTVGESYQRTGKDGYARAFAWLVLRAKEHRDTNPTTYGGPWGMDSDFRAYRVFPAWDVVEESPALTAEERMAVTRVLFQWMQEAVVPPAASMMGATRPRHNHNTFPSLGCMYAGEYFEKYYQAGEGTRWLQVADDCFRHQAQAFKPHEDCNGYQWLTLYHTLLYHLARPDFTYFENGNARRSADYAIMCMDNLGYSVTYGDTGAFTGWWSEMPFLHGAEWYYRDGRYCWATDKKRAVSGRLGISWFAVKSQPQEPIDLLGARAFPVDPLYFEAQHGDEQMSLEQAVDKIVFRDGFDPEDQYLLLDGLNNGGHKHYDGNSISRMTANGRIWLADASYMASLPKYHSTALVLRDGQSGPLPDFCELEHMRDLPSVALSETVLRDYAGVDWHRNIFWLKGAWFVVADEMQAREAGDYSFRMLWHTIGDVTLGDDGMTVRQQGQYCDIRMTPELRFTLEHDEEYGQNWRGYEFIEDAVVHKMTGIWNGHLDAGQQITLFTLLHPSGDTPSTLRLTRLGPDAVAVTGEGVAPTLVAVGGPDALMALADQVRIRGHATVARPGLLALFDTESMEYQWEVMDFYGGRDVEMALGKGDIVTYLSAGRTAQPSDQFITENYPEIAAVSDDQVQAMLGAAIAAAPPPERQEPAGAAAPEMTRLWSYGEKLESYLLTGNQGMFGAVDTGVTLAAQPDPLPHNVFQGPEEQSNTVDSIVDGGVQSTDDCTQWDDDQTVTVTMDFDRVYEIDSIAVRAWFATSSSKGKLFQLQDIRIDASDDAFEGDERTIVEFTDTEMHGNWGAPGHAPHLYGFADLDTQARNLRFTFTPRPGTAVYIAEIEVWGGAEGIEQLALRPGSNVPVHSFIALDPADIDGDGADEIIAGSTNGKVYLFESDGTVTWTREIGGPVRAVSAARLAGQDRPAVVAGGTSATLFAFSAQGDELWTTEMPRYKRAGVITTVFPADLDGDGSDEVVAGTESWRYYAFDATGAEIWRVESVRMSTVGAAGDLDGDGQDEVVAGTEYHSWPVYDSDGKKMFGYPPRTGPGCNDVALTDLTGDELPDIIFAGLDSFVHAVSATGDLLWKFGTGDSVSAVAAVEGEGDARVVAGSRSFNLYGFAADGTIAWRHDLGDPIVDVATLTTDQGQRIAATTEAGTVVLADAVDGALIGSAQLLRGGIVVAPADLDGDGSQEVVVSSRDGNLTALR